MASCLGVTESMPDLIAMSEENRLCKGCQAPIGPEGENVSIIGDVIDP